MAQYSRPVRITLLADGTSDLVLRGPLDWLLQEYFPCEYLFQFADQIPSGPALGTRICAAVADYPCDILLVHRDAERKFARTRLAEIEAAIKSATEAALELIAVKCVRIVPVRMTEAWFLFDEAAIRRAANRPHASDTLFLPTVSAARLMPDPKEVLRQLLESASGLSGRKLERFTRDHPSHYHRICNLVTDFAPLMEVPEFVAFKDELVAAMTAFKNPAHG